MSKEYFPRLITTFIQSQEGVRELGTRPMICVPGVFFFVRSGVKMLSWAFLDVFIKIVNQAALHPVLWELRNRTCILSEVDPQNSAERLVVRMFYEFLAESERLRKGSPTPSRIRKKLSVAAKKNYCKIIWKRKELRRFWEMKLLPFLAFLGSSRAGPSFLDFWKESDFFALQVRDQISKNGLGNRFLKAYKEVREVSAFYQSAGLCQSTISSPTYSPTSRLSGLNLTLIFWL